MRRGFAGILLFAFVLPTCVQAQQGELPAGCDDSLGSVPGGPKGYNLFANLAASAKGCTSPSPVTYEKIDGQKADARSAPSGRLAPSRSVTPQQEEIDRAACRNEGENAAKAARGLQPGEYDLFKNIAATRSGDVEQVEQSCMAQRGYNKVAN
jgi:hypothetical protein